MTLLTNLQIGTSGSRPLTNNAQISKGALFPWTVFPEHTVSNKLWALNVSQSTALTIAYFDFAESDTYEALKKIAAFPMIPNGRSPGLDDFSIVRRVCVNLFKHSPKAP